MASKKNVSLIALILFLLVIVLFIYRINKNNTQKVVSGIPAVMSPVIENAKNQPLITLDSLGLVSPEEDGTMPNQFLASAVETIEIYRASGDNKKFQESNYSGGYVFSCMWEACLIVSRTDNLNSKWQLFAYVFDGEQKGVQAITEPFDYHNSGGEMPSLEFTNPFRGLLLMSDGDGCYSSSTHSMITLDKENAYKNPHIMQSFSTGNDCSTFDFLSYSKNGVMYTIEPIVSGECQTDDGTQSVVIIGIKATSSVKTFEQIFTEPFTAQCVSSDYVHKSPNVSITFSGVDFSYDKNLKFIVSVGNVKDDGTLGEWLFNQNLQFSQEKGFIISPY